MHIKQRLASRSMVPYFWAAICLVAMQLHVVAKTPNVVASVDVLPQLKGTKNSAVQVLGYSEPGDGGGGVFYWTDHYEEEVDGFTVVAASGGEGYWVRLIEDGRLNVKWFGAVGDAATDDTQALRNALAAAERRSVTRLNTHVSTLYAHPVVYFPPGEYHAYDTLAIHRGPITLQGAHSMTSRIRYMGDDFKDLLYIDFTEDKGRSMKIFDLGLYGGEYLRGRARYVIHGKRFTTRSQIQRCIIRDGVGLLRLDGCYYADVSYNQIMSINPSPTHLSAEQIAEVHGTGSAPVYLTGGGSFTFSKNALFGLALSEEMPTSTFRSIYLRSQASDFSNNSIEGVAEGKIPEYLLWVSGNINIGQLYMERVEAKRALMMVQGGSTLSSFTQPMFYRVAAPVIFENESVGDVVIRNGFFYRVLAAKLFEVNAPRFGSEGSDVIFESCIFLAGERYRSEEHFKYDQRGNPFARLGVADGIGGRAVIPAVFPSVVSGYDVDYGLDQYGPYVAVSGGVFRSERGVHVNNRQLTLIDGVEVDKPPPEGEGDEQTVTRAQILRFPEANTRQQWYRLFVGRAGQPYLKSYANMPDSKGGDWLIQFKLGANDHFEQLQSNPLLTLDGTYSIPSMGVSYHVGQAPPESGFWLAGDRVQKVISKRNDEMRGWICVESGSPGTWEAF